MPARHGAFLEVGLVAAVVDRHGVLREVQFHDGGHAAGEELAVVGNQHHAAAQALHEGLELGQSVEVQVVRGFVQEHDVEAAEQQCRERHAGGLAAGEPGHVGVLAHVEAEVRQHSRDAVFQVGGAGGHPAVEREGVVVVGAGGATAKGLRGGLHLQGGLGAAGAPRDVAAHRFAGDPFVFLGQPAHERVCRGKADRAFLRLVHAGQEPEQGGFARAIGSHDADDVARRDGQGEFGEEGAVVVTTGEVLGNKGCSH